MRTKEFTPVIVESAPAQLEPGILYISIKYHTVLHLCACGCGEEVVIPLAPDQWQLLYDGKTVSLRPSIGNFRFPCQSHYFISKNKVEWVSDSDLGHRRRKKKPRSRLGRWFKRKK